MSTPAEVFWDRHAPRYVAKPIADQPSYEAKLNHVRSLLQPTDKVLEIGCGSGKTALQLAPACASVTASDLSSRMIECARSQKCHDLGIQFAALGSGRSGDAPCDTRSIEAWRPVHLEDGLHRRAKHWHPGVCSVYVMGTVHTRCEPALPIRTPGHDPEYRF